jgi:hypothetical protein
MPGKPVTQIDRRDWTCKQTLMIGKKSLYNYKMQYQFIHFGTGTVFQCKY